jgi:3'-phosphoadenosine 5'-phosphosulfate (PAPS) 3'-phosphatase
MTSDSVSLQKLLSTCYSLSSQACSIIRSVQARREKKGATALKATLKDKNDSRTYLTEADTAAQELIWNGLRTVFGSKLNIVGEEDAIEEEKNWTIKDETVADVLNGYDIPIDLQNLVFSDVIVFIDPVDGTREFVEGRLDACQNLIGISYRGRAVAGVVGLPFTRYWGEIGVDNFVLFIYLGMALMMMNQQYVVEILKQKSYLALLVPQMVFMVFLIVRTTVLLKNLSWSLEYLLILEKRNQH